MKIINIQDIESLTRQELLKNFLPETKIKYSLGKSVINKISQSKDCFKLISMLFDKDAIAYCESFVVLALNRANAVIAWKTVSVGGVSATVVDPKTIFNFLISVNASGFIISHNHPAGQSHPSEQDKRVTQKLKEGGKILEVTLLDHIIISALDINNYYSFADSGLL